ncbi:PDZ domain-containing protein [Paraburkholderia megapolitana]|nr:PDZ domain-containing protein [Paraburkholderia megapolitana]
MSKAIDALAVAPWRYPLYLRMRYSPTSHDLSMPASRLHRRYSSLALPRTCGSIVLILVGLLFGTARADVAGSTSNVAQGASSQRSIVLPTAQADCRPMLIEGTASSKGFVGRFLIASDPQAQVATIQVTDAGPANFAFGVSSSHAWVRGVDGVVRDADFDGYRAGIVSDAYWLGGGLLNRCWPAKIDLLRTDRINGTAVDVLQVLPLGGKTTTAWVSHATHLPLRWSRRDEPDVATTTYSDYRRVGKRLVPFKQSMVDRDSNRWDLKDIRIQSGVDPAIVAVKARKPDAAVNDYGIDGGETTTIPMSSREKPHVDVFINGKGPFSFLFDTGSALTLSKTTAQAAGLELVGEGHDTGFAGIAITTRFARIKDLRLGAAHVRDQYATVFDDASGGVGAQTAGLIGYEVLARFTTTFDFPRRTVTLSLTPDRTVLDDSHALPLMLDHTVPVIAAEIDGVADHLWLDTGANTALVVNRAFMNAHPGAAPKRLYDVNGSLGGVGGSGATRFGRIPRLSIGSNTFADVIAMFPGFDRGLNTDSEFAADMGTPLLKSSVLTFDYASHRIWLTSQDAPVGPEIPVYNRAGFGIEYAQGDVATVSYVREGSPAAEVGLQQGDRVIEIDGKPVSAQAVSLVKAQFGTFDNALIKLAVLRDGKVLDFSVRPRDYIQ